MSLRWCCTTGKNVGFGVAAYLHDGDECDGTVQRLKDWTDANLAIVMTMIVVTMADVMQPKELEFVRIILRFALKTGG